MMTRKMRRFHTALLLQCLFVFQSNYSMLRVFVSTKLSPPARAKCVLSSLFRLLFCPLAFSLSWKDCCWSWAGGGWASRRWCRSWERINLKCNKFCGGLHLSRNWRHDRRKVYLILFFGNPRIDCYRKEISSKNIESSFRYSHYSINLWHWNQKATNRAWPCTECCMPTK